MTRDRIFAAAKNIFEKEGLDGLSIRNVGRQAGLSTMAMYRHFADKDALVDALMQDGFAAWESRVRAIDCDDPIDWLKRLMEAYLEFAIAEPHRFDAAFLLAARTARKYPDDFALGRSPAIGLAVQRIDKAKAQGRLKDVPSLDIALTMSALGQGVISMQRAGRFASETDLRASYAMSVGYAIAFFSDQTSAHTGGST